MTNVEWNTTRHSHDYNQWGELLAGVRGYIYNPVDNNDVYYRTNFMSDEELNWINQKRVSIKLAPLFRLARDIGGYKIVSNQSSKIAHEKATFTNIDYSKLFAETTDKLKGKFSIDNYLRADTQELDF